MNRPAILSVGIIDDSREDAEMLEDHLRDAGYEVGLVRLSSVAEEICDEVQHNYSAAICDHVLRHGSPFREDGASLAASLFRRGVPVILVSARLEGHSGASIRPYRRHLPAVLSRLEIDDVRIKAAFAECVEELGGHLSSKRRPHRTIIRVEDCFMERKLADVVVHGWDSRMVVPMSLEFLPPATLAGIVRGAQLIADVNLGADRAEELYFDNVELAPSIDGIDDLP